MSISIKVQNSIKASSWIRKMFEEGEKLKKEFGKENIYDFSLGNPITEPPRQLKKRVAEIFSSDEAGMSRYMPNAGFEFVRDALAKSISARGRSKLESADIVMTVGAAGGLNLILKTLLDKEDEVIIISPYFPEYLFYIDNHSGITKIADSNDNDFSLNIENIKNAITEKTKAVIINSPNNPTGAIYSESSLQELSKLLNDQFKKSGKKIYLISDEPYLKLNLSGKKIAHIVDLYDDSIIVGSFSKDLSLAGERIGYVAISSSIYQKESLRAGLVFSNRILGYVNAPAIWQRIAAEFINYQPDLSCYMENRDLLVDSLSKIGYEFKIPDGGFYLFLKSPLPDELEFVDLLRKEAQILTVPGRGFGKEGYIRLAFCVKKEQIMKSMAGFGSVFEKTRSKK